MFVTRLLSRVASGSPWKAVILVGCYSALLLVAGIGFGKWAVDHHLKGRIVAKLQSTPLKSLFARGKEESEDETAPLDQVSDVQHVDWSASPSLNSNLYYPQVAKLKLAPFETYGEGGSLEQVAGNILYASPTGQIGYLARDNVLHVLATRVPMRFDLLTTHAISKDPRFVMSYFRTLDMLVINEPDGAFQLYVSHHRFNSAGCFEFVVSRTHGRALEGGIDLVDDWKDVFVARPCMATKEIDLLWGGLESGGRLAMLDAKTLLVTVGDHQFDGVRSPQQAAQDPDVDLGKTVAVNLTTGRSRIFTSGHRNPQGLIVARDGTIWQTEHAPQGGDEINLLKEGLNYGWPKVTYGVDYGPRTGPRRNWPLNTEQGRHDGFAQPSFAFVPSIGISNLVQPDPREWPLWRDHLLVISLGGLQREGGGKLYLVRPESDKRILYSEEIALPLANGEKLRDILSLSDGRIAILSESGALLLIRNSEPPASAAAREGKFDVTLGEDAKLARQNSTLVKLPTQLEIGRQVFASKCASCHTLDGTIKVGPPLNGIDGRRVGSFEGFAYSSGMKADQSVWREWTLAEFLQNFEQPYKDSPMPRPLLSARSARAVAAFLKNQ